MKKIFTLFLGGMLALLCTGTVLAQTKAVTRIVSVKQKENDVNFNLSSSKPFIFGSNRYELHIGTSEFFRNTQSVKDGKGSMTFFIPAEAYNNLQEGSEIFLCYGHMAKGDKVNMEQLSKVSNKCWQLGKFSRKMLTK